MHLLPGGLEVVWSPEVVVLDLLGPLVVLFVCSLVVVVLWSMVVVFVGGDVVGLILLKSKIIKELKKPSTTLQSAMNAKLTQQRFWRCHENGIIKTIQTIPYSIWVSVKSASL